MTVKGTRRLNAGQDAVFRFRASGSVPRLRFMVKGLGSRFSGFLRVQGLGFAL